MALSMDSASVTPSSSMRTLRDREAHPDGDRGNQLITVGRLPYDFHERGCGYRVEEVCADQGGGVVKYGAHLGHRRRTGIGGQHSTWEGLLEPGEDVALDLENLGHSLDREFDRLPSPRFHRARRIVGFHERHCRSVSCEDVRDSDAHAAAPDHDYAGGKCLHGAPFRTSWVILGTI